MIQDIAKRLGSVRDEMARNNLDAFIVPRADEYLGEYVPVRNERMQWLSGFSGSAGLLVIMRERAAVFVDGRYTIQVRQQVPESLFEFHHLVEEPHQQWLLDNLPQGARVGYDPRLHSLRWQKEISKVLNRKQIPLCPVAANPIDLAWADRPAPGKAPVMLLGEEYTGVHSRVKRQRVGELISKKGPTRRWSPNWTPSPGC